MYIKKKPKLHFHLLQKKKEEIIKFSWWTSKRVHYFTKKLQPV